MKATHAITLTCLLLTLAGVGCGREQSAEESVMEAGAKVLRITAIPDQNTTELKEKFGPLVDHLSRVLEVPVEYVPAHDYQASVEMFKNGDAQLAWFGGLTGVQARHAVPGARALAQGQADPNYYSYFIAHKSTGLQPSTEFPEGIADLKLTFGSESSTSGRLMPEHFIVENTGKSPRELFTQTVGFSGSHDRTVEWVESGTYELGVVNYKVYDQRVAAGKTDPDVCRVIWKTPTYADYNWTAHPEVDDLFGAGFMDRLQDALVAIDDPQLLAALPRDRLIPASNEAYEGIHQVALSLGMVR